jgi:hypothetical protein
MSEIGNGVVPPERRAFVQELIDERNSLVQQVERLESRVAVIDAQIAAAGEP